jgi:hypothetical protein
MNTLNLLKTFSEEHKKPLNKKYILKDAISNMYYIQAILERQNLFIIDDEDNEKPIIEINIDWISIDGYKHLTTDKNLLREIKKEAVKIIKRYNDYFHEQHFLKNIKYEN